MDTYLKSAIQKTRVCFFVFFFFGKVSEILTEESYLIKKLLH